MVGLKKISNCSHWLKREDGRTILNQTECRTISHYDAFISAYALVRFEVYEQHKAETSFFRYKYSFVLKEYNITSIRTMCIISTIPDLSLSLFFFTSHGMFSKRILPKTCDVKYLLQTLPARNRGGSSICRGPGLSVSYAIESTSIHANTLS